MANPELGAKQICPACQSKFYDLNRRPATCPKCGNEFDPEEAVRSRRARARSSTVPDYDTDEEKEVKAKDEDQEGFEEEADDTPEIDQAIESDNVDSDEDEGDDASSSGGAGGGDIGVDFAEDEEISEADEDVPFLEDEDDEDFSEDDIEGLPGEGEDDR